MPGGAREQKREESRDRNRETELERREEGKRKSKEAENERREGEGNRMNRSEKGSFSSKKETGRKEGARDDCKGRKRQKGSVRK